MRIHCINPDDAYNSLLPVDPQFFKKVGGSFKPDTPQGFGKADPEPILRVRDKALKQGNFTGFMLGCLTCDREALESAKTGPVTSGLDAAGGAGPAAARAVLHQYHGGV